MLCETTVVENNNFSVIVARKMTRLTTKEISNNMSIFLSETRLLNAMVDVRHCHETIFGNISETTKASNFKIYHNVAHESLYISTGNDITIFFRSAANRTDVSILGHVQVVISR